MRETQHSGADTAADYFSAPHPARADRLARSEAVHEIISGHPGFLERWALAIFLVILAIVIGGAWAMKYPQMIEVPATLVSADRPEQAPASHLTGERYTVQMLLPSQAIGKIKLGQVVQLRFDDYPYQEFGSVDGVLENMPATAPGEAFRMHIRLPAGLHTSAGKTIPYHDGMHSRILIRVGSSRLLQRFYQHEVVEKR